ncbi:hypothetical protein HPP92_009464 [Vanilla planifolia]|uniref:Uncharacterized protein n=1 Tax=Vanilla planifolia TaxID=51239 RepID=A0A835RCF3_VANPL|nr:hypothetical protein HPP92_009464 [Vanilla planifolia]
MFYEIVIAPHYTDEGLEVLRGKSKNLRILEAKKTKKGLFSLRQVGGDEDIEFKVKSERCPQTNELSDAQFAWLCVKHVKSNAIVIAKWSAKQIGELENCFRKAGDEVKGAALASDAFFPFAWNDAVEEACKQGVGLIAEPGGSIRDADAIDCCNKYGVSAFHQWALQALRGAPSS